MKYVNQFWDESTNCHLMLNYSSDLESKNSEVSVSGVLYLYFGCIKTTGVEWKNTDVDTMCGNIFSPVTQK